MFLARQPQVRFPAFPKIFLWDLLTALLRVKWTGTKNRKGVVGNELLLETRTMLGNRSVNDVTLKDRWSAFSRFLIPGCPWRRTACSERSGTWRSQAFLLLLLLRRSLNSFSAKRIIFYSTLSFGQKDWKGFQPATRAKEKAWNAISGIKLKKWPFSKGLATTRPLKKGCVFNSCLLETHKITQTFQNLTIEFTSDVQGNLLYFDGSLRNTKISWWFLYPFKRNQSFLEFLKLSSESNWAWKTQLMPLRKLDLAFDFSKKGKSLRMCAAK